MRIYPVSSNVIKVELVDGTMFELYEGGTEGLEISLSNSTGMIASELNVKTINFDGVWKGHTIRLVEATE